MLSKGDFHIHSNFSDGKFSVSELLDLYKKLPFFAHSSKMFRNKYSNEFWDKGHS